MAEWTAAHDRALRDTVLLLPFAQLLGPARRAFGHAGGWQPRIETTRTFAASLGPMPATAAWQIAFDAAADRLTADRLLRAQERGAVWARADARGFAHAVGVVVETAQAMALAAAAIAPGDRAEHWAQARLRLGPRAGPGERQRWLARIALEWAAQAATPATDRLFGFIPAAWVALQVGGAQPLVEAVMAAAPDATACLAIDAEAAAPWLALSQPAPARVVCDSFEHEAQCAAAQVLVHLERGEQPVALVGQDRLLVRRVRALLERQQVPLADETGWALSTTRAAAQVMLLLRAAAPGAGTDALFDWLKTLATWPGRAELAIDIRRLERFCRRAGIARIAELDAVAPDGEVAAFCAALSTVLDRFDDTRRLAAEWLDRLGAALDGCGAWSALQADEAGRSVLAALHLEARPAGASAWRDGAGGTVLSRQSFVDWVGAVLEQASFLPSPPAGGEARVVITPLARVMLRPFAAVVCPGADDRHLGMRPAPHPLLSEAELEALRLPTAATRQRREALAFAQVLRLPRLTFLRRRNDGVDPLADSLLLQRLAIELARQGRGFAPWTDARERIERTAEPVLRPAPAAGALLPTRLSASAAEALRDCPYRFFSRHVLGLREDDELEGEVEKRDYGDWLHAVLDEFHRNRATPQGTAADQTQLHRIAHAVQQAARLSDDEFLPYLSFFDAFVPRYLRWLHERDAQGARWIAGEAERAVRPDALGGIELYGRIDRIDRHADGTIELIDYKTGSREGLKEKLREPLEDTQLAFYAALEAPQAGGVPLRAMYLALDERKRIEPVPHPEVERDAATLVRELGREFGLLRAGAGLPALGEPPTCDHCEARGLCRRDHWPQGGG